ncbi:MAG TPA: hypothetical protein DD624_05960 [Alphaproteobacteria bacterium]|nr:hypothetical protein [Alphaproteobacteria bacterium]
MITEGITITAAGMGGVFLFLLLLVCAMYAQAWIFNYLGITDEAEPAENDSAADDAAIAAAIAVKIKNG